MSDEVNVNVCINRSSQGDISIRIADSASRLRIAEVTMTPEMFGDCVTGLSFCAGILTHVVEADEVEAIGKRRIVKNASCERVASLNRLDQQHAVNTHFFNHYRPLGWKLLNNGIGTQQRGEKHQYTIYRYED